MKLTYDEFPDQFETELFLGSSPEALIDFFNVQLIDPEVIETNLARYHEQVRREIASRIFFDIQHTRRGKIIFSLKKEPRWKQEYFLSGGNNGSG